MILPTTATTTRWNLGSLRSRDEYSSSTLPVHPSLIGLSEIILTNLAQVLPYQVSTGYSFADCKAMRTGSQNEGRYILLKCNDAGTISNLWIGNFRDATCSIALLRRRLLSSSLITSQLNLPCLGERLMIHFLRCPPDHEHKG